MTGNVPAGKPPPEDGYTRQCRTGRFFGGRHRPGGDVLVRGAVTASRLIGHSGQNECEFGRLCNYCLRRGTDTGIRRRKAEFMQGFRDE